MNRIQVFLVLLAAVCINLSAQKTSLEKYNWDSIEEPLVEDTLEFKNGAKFLLERFATEVYLSEQNVFEEIYVHHRKIAVMTDKAVENWNVIYIPAGNIIDVITMKVRFITPEGDVIDVPKENFKETENLENVGDYYSVVVDGAVVGGSIEYVYVLRRSMITSGTIKVQKNVPIFQFSYDITFPKELTFYTKSYNGLNDPVINNENESTTEITLSQNNIVPLEEERYAYLDLNLMRCEYTLTHNKFRANYPIISKATYGDNLYERLYPFSKKEIKSVNKVLGSLDLKGKSSEHKVRQIENWVKGNIRFAEEADSYEEINLVVKNRLAGEIGALKLFSAFFDIAEISYEIVVTTEKQNKLFDLDFPGYNFIKKFLIYIPEINEFLVPFDNEFRIGVLPYKYNGNYGLAYSKLKYNEDLSTLGYSNISIPDSYHHDNTDSMIVKLNLSLEDNILEANIFRSFSGTIGQQFQAYWHFFDDEKKRELLAQVMDVGLQEAELIDYTVKNCTPEDIGVDPVTFEVIVKSGHVLEMAGEDYILRIGEVIGEQAHLYNAKPRTQAIQIDALRNYYRKVIMDIPEGYTLLNLDDVNIKKTVVTDGEVSAIFHSFYEMEGKQLLIYNLEYYAQQNYPIEKYEEFREVVNAAADFNKSTILLTPTK